jgi:hypothetical protein
LVFGSAEWWKAARVWQAEMASGFIRGDAAKQSSEDGFAAF